MKRTTSEAYFTQRLAALLQQSTIEVLSHKRYNAAAGRPVYDVTRPSRATRRRVAATQRRLKTVARGNKVEIKLNGVALEAV